MAAVHLENLLFLLFIAIAFLFQLLTRAASKTNKEPDETKPRSPNVPPTPPRVRPETDQDRIRKFLEALGQPPGSTPPPPVPSRPTYQKPVVLPRVRPFQSPLPPLKTRPPETEAELPRPRKTVQRPMAQPVFEVDERRAGTAEAPVVPTPFVPTPVSAQPDVVRPTERINAITLLKTQNGLREAIILREIFGPPRSMQPTESL